ncbi:hypothetical protein BDQ17DRAFT_1436570 [Cyathus striatus]|nr:hypothetical protein BDQ17DRAFT_1436570 [Cyathus striatus]
MSKISKTGKLGFGILGRSPKGWGLFAITSVPPVQRSPQAPQSQLQKHSVQFFLFQQFPTPPRIEMRLHMADN